MAVANPPVYQEIYYFLASAPSREAILDFRPSLAAQERLKILLAAESDGQLTVEEHAELEEFEEAEHFVRMLKLFTRQMMADHS